MLGYVDLFCSMTEIAQSSFSSAFILFAQISTVRRNDILLGMNETSNMILPPLFELLSKQYGDVNNAKNILLGMNQYLASNGRTVAQMAPDERAQYQQQIDKRDAAGGTVADILGTLEKFCQSMPLDWMLKVENQYHFQL